MMPFNRNGLSVQKTVFRTKSDAFPVSPVQPEPHVPSVQAPSVEAAVSPVMQAPVVAHTDFLFDLPSGPPVLQRQVEAVVRFEPSGDDDGMTPGERLRAQL